MTPLLKMTAAACAFAGFAAPVFAQDTMVDPMTMTCAEYSAMDSTAMMSATSNMDMMMAMTEEERTAAMAMTPEEKTAMMTESMAAMDAMTDEEKATAKTAHEASMMKITEACKAMPDGTAMDAMKSSM